MFGTRSYYLAIARAARRRAQQLVQAPPQELSAAIISAAAAIMRDGLSHETVTPAIACVAAQAEKTLGFRVFTTQLFCAATLLEQRMAEMATGEGKTLAAAIAAAVGGLAGIPVHVLTANEYLAERDAQTLGPFYQALGLSVGVALESSQPVVRQVAYAADIVYATARTVAFDYLRDKLIRTNDRSDLELRVSSIERTASNNSAGGAKSPLMLRGLCMAIIDEADSILIDEAKMPLIISDGVRDPVERARSWQALDMARRLEPKRHYRIHREARRVTLTEKGRNEAAVLAADYGEIWLNRLHREELVEQALTALRLLHRDHDYLIKDGEVVIIDAVTGRTAPGRIWSRGLHSAVALKEGLEPPPVSQTRAQITYPRLFSRYHHLCGLSGTLSEVSDELRETYELVTVNVPLQRKSRRRTLPARVYKRRTDLFLSAAQRAREVIASGRPVLVTVDSVLDSRLLVSMLQKQGTPCSELNARTNTEEAQVIAQAGQTACVTVATQMAGRGTDILLSKAVHKAGGLHVLNLQHNRSRRLDRQIAGRAGRQGQPGSYEHWICLETPLMNVSWLASGFERFATGKLAQGALAYRIVNRAQRMAEREDAALRKATSRQDKDWSESLHFTSMNE